MWEAILASARERFTYVLKRMQEDKVAEANLVTPGVTPAPRIVPYEKPRREVGFHFIDHLMREARALVAPQAAHDLEHLAELGDPLARRRPRVAVGAVLVVVPPGADAPVEPAPRDHVEIGRAHV